MGGIRLSSRRVRLLAAVLAAGLALAGGLMVAGHASAQAGTVVRIDPTPQTVPQFSVTSVDIRVDNIPDPGLYGADVRLWFSPNIIEAKDSDGAQAGIQIVPGPLLTSGGPYFVFRNVAQNVTGTVEFIITQFNPSPPVTGSGVLATIFYTGVAGDFSPVQFTYVKLSDRNGIQIPATSQDGRINVQGPTSVRLASFGAQVAEPSAEREAPAVLLMLAAIASLLGAGWSMRRRR